MEQASMASLIGSLRLVSTFDWSEFFESVSLVEQVLQQDPAGAYAGMDFLSRDRYRHAVEELADPTGDSQLRIARLSVERARRVGEQTPAARGAHVGYYLIGGGRREFERSLEWKPPLRQRIRRFLFRHATPGYLGTIAAGTAALVAAAVAYASRYGWQESALLVVLLTLVPASSRSAATLAARQADGGARRCSHDGDRADAARERGTGTRSRGSPRSPGPRQHRSPHPFWHSERLS
jgi:cyclic beta-1,2-glucan synthetase